MTERDYSALDAAIANLNLDYNWRFVPWRQSRNKDQKDPSLNWVITLTKKGAVSSVELVTDYMAGIGHVPGYQKLKDAGRHPENAAHTGKYFVSNIHSKTLPPPTLRDVLYSLVMDSYVLESAGFESWASEFGYDTDSRKAEATYKACVEIALKLKALIGLEALDKLRDLYQGY